MKTYSPVMHLRSGIWGLGIIENYQARSLTRDEIDELLAELKSLRKENKKLRQNLDEAVKTL